MAHLKDTPARLTTVLSSCGSRRRSCSCAELSLDDVIDVWVGTEGRRASGQRGQRRRSGRRSVDDAAERSDVLM